MLGAIIGDIVGSRFEFNNHLSKDFELFSDNCFVTDDSIMTLAIAKAILASEGDWKRLGKNAVTYMHKTGRKYPDSGYGGMFRKWMFDDEPEPYNSFGNGAAMRVSPCGFFACTEDEVKTFSQKFTEVTHNHPEGLKGAEAVLAIFLARTGATKDEIMARIVQDYYALGFSLDEIRGTYQFNETEFTAYLYELEAEFEDGAIAAHHGGGIYHYRTTDLRIDIGDTVVVPVGEDNHEQIVTVVTVEHCRWDNTPYPLEKTKPILRTASDKEGGTPILRLSGNVPTLRLTSENDIYNEGDNNI